jgi:monoamine oxidase
VHYIEANWSDEPWSQGGMIGHYPPGVLTTYGQNIRQPVGRIHWAGTETATRFHGLIEGAIRSAERAADEVLAAS